MWRVSSLVLSVLLSGCLLEPVREPPEMKPADVESPEAPPEDGCDLQPETGGKVIQVATEKEFKSLVESSKTVAVVVGADWCSACRAYKPTVERVAKSSQAVVFCEVNADKLPQVRRQMKVSAYPTTVVLRAGKEHKRLVGVQAENVLLQAIR